MSIIESIAVALHYKNIHIFYVDMHSLEGVCTTFILQGLLYLRYKKVINFITLKCLGMMTIVVFVSIVYPPSIIIKVMLIPIIFINICAVVIRLNVGKY